MIDHSTEESLEHMQREWEAFKAHKGFPPMRCPNCQGAYNWTHAVDDEGNWVLPMRSRCRHCGKYSTLEALQANRSWEGLGPTKEHPMGHDGAHTAGNLP